MLIKNCNYFVNHMLKYTSTNMTFLDIKLEFVVILLINVTMY